MALNTLRDLFAGRLLKLHAAEKQWVRLLPELAKAVMSQSLSGAFERHFRTTQHQITRLEWIFKCLAIAPRQPQQTSNGMSGLLEDCRIMMRDSAEAHVRDAALVSLAQQVMHNLIADYGCVRAWARLLGDEEAAGLLQETLDDEKEMDGTLTELAYAINPQACPLCV